MYKHEHSLRMHVITSFAVDKHFNNDHIYSAIKINSYYPDIEQIHILTESYLPDVKAALDKYGISNKYTLICNDKRPSFGDILCYINALFDADNNICVALINSDIYFRDEGVVKDLLLFQSNNRASADAVIAITRHELSGSIALFHSNGLPNFLSADAWVFSARIDILADQFYCLGDMNCDLMFAYDLYSSGYKIINPCLDTYIIHNEKQLKTNSFYNSQNETSKATDAIYKFIAARVNSNNYVVGVPWNKREWAAAGYLPRPISHLEEKALWVFCHGEINETCALALVASLECLAAFYNANLNIFVEELFANDFIIKIRQCLLSNNRIYIYTTSDHDTELTMFISGGLSDYNNESLCLVSDLSRLNKNILVEYKNIAIDARNIHDSLHISYDSAEVLGLNINWFLENRYHGKITVSQALYTERKCSLITSLYKSDKYLDGFLNNSRHILYYSDINHYFIYSSTSTIEQTLLLEQLKTYKNTILLWNKRDPGLYNSWNLGLRMLTTEYVSNANVDDLRDSMHVDILIKILEDNPHYLFAASALYPFYEYSYNVDTFKTGTPWYRDQAGVIGFRALGTLEADKDGLICLKPHNIPHCMPIWRKSIHDSYGYFDENKYGTYADWAFWLKTTLGGESGYLHGEGLGYYYVNLESHNRRGNDLSLFHQRIEREFLPHFSLEDRLYKKLHRPEHAASKARNADFSLNDPQSSESVSPKKLDLYGVDLSYGNHRNDFNLLIKALMPLHCGEGGIIFLPFIERYFVWGNNMGEAGSAEPRPLSRPWIGIVHVPFDSPPWFSPHVYPETIFETKLWKESLPYCKGLIALSDDLRRDLSMRYPDIPNVTLYHPTDFHNLKPFNFERFAQDPTIVQAGDWLRKLQYIYRVGSTGFKKILLLKPHTKSYLNSEISVFGDYRNDSVNVLDMVSNEDYDDLLSRSVVLCQVYATAANNIVLECIARKTPIIVNSLPSVIEYLGDGYPLYADSFERINEILNDTELIESAHLYLVKNKLKFENSLSYSKFFEDFSSSIFYKNL